MTLALFEIRNRSAYGNIEERRGNQSTQAKRRERESRATTVVFPILYSGKIVLSVRMFNNFCNHLFNVDAAVIF